MAGTDGGRLLASWLAAAVALAAGPVEVRPPEDLQALTTRHYRIHAPAGAMAVARETAADLEALYVFLDTSVGALTPLKAQPAQARLFLFPGPDRLEAFLAGLPPGTLNDSFPGLPFSLTHRFAALDSSAILGRSDLAILLHEAAHLLLQTSLYGEGVTGSWWVREGIATYIMQTRFDENIVFTPGAIRTNEGYIARLSPGGRAAEMVSFALQPKRAAAGARSAYKEGRHIPLERLLAQEADQPWPDAATRDLAAVESWILVHFLLHGAQGELRPRLARYLEQEKVGKGGLDTFRRLVAGDVAALEPPLFRHVKEMD